MAVGYMSFTVFPQSITFGLLAIKTPYKAYNSGLFDFNCIPS
jgi:hypothetical protein